MQRNPVVIQAGASALQTPYWHRTTAEDEGTKLIAAPAAITKPTSTPQRSYEIVPIRPENYEDVMSFLRRTFFLDEPLNVCLQLVSSSEPGACPELEEFSMMALTQGVSLMAVAPCGRVIGACLNGVSQPGDVAELEERAISCPNSKFKLILGLLAHVEKSSDVHHKFDVENVFEVPMLSVDGAWRGQGIATALLSGSVQLARRLGYPLFRVDCSSEFTARAVAKLGLYPVYTMRYDEYRPSEDAEPPFRPAPPHHEVKAYVLPLNV